MCVAVARCSISTNTTRALCSALKQGFKECFRVLEPNGTLIFKWNETDVKLKEILQLTDQKPVLGHKSGKRSNTHWVLFMKPAAAKSEIPEKKSIAKTQEKSAPKQPKKNNAQNSR